MKPPDEDIGRSAGEPVPEGTPLGVVEVGRYTLRVGSPSGTIVERSQKPADGDPDALVRALGGPDAEGGQSAAAAASDAVEEASEVTAKIERAATLGKGVAAGDALDPEQLSLEVDTLIGLLERLDRQGRWKEALRLARALTTLLSLLKRWVSLLRALQAALRASQQLGDLGGIAWAKHELGTLQVAAEDVTAAERNLREALEIRERLGDRRGVAATNRCLHVLCHQLRQLLHEGRLVVRRGRFQGIARRPAPLAIIAAAVLALGGVAGGVVGGGLLNGSSGTTASAGTASTSTGSSGTTTATTTTEPTTETNTSGSTSTSTGTGTTTTSSTVPLSIAIVGGGSGIVRSNPPGIECSTKCSESFPLDSEVVLAAEPGEESLFEGFSGSCSGTECLLTMETAHSVTATFAPSPEEKTPAG